jgi:hypothetical protein
MALICTVFAIKKVLHTFSIGGNELFDILMLMQMPLNSTALLMGYIYCEIFAKATGSTTKHQITSH